MNTYFLEKIKQYYLNNPGASSPGQLWFALCQNFPVAKPIPYIFFRREYADQQIVNQMVNYQDSDNVESSRHAFIYQLIKNGFANQTINPKGLLVEMMQVFQAIHPSYLINLNYQVTPYLIEPSIQEARAIFKLICNQNSNLVEHVEYINNNLPDLLLNLQDNEKLHLLDIQYQAILKNTDITEKSYENFTYYFGELPQKQAANYIRKMFDYMQSAGLENAEKIRTINVIIQCLPFFDKKIKQEVYQKLLDIVDVSQNVEAMIVAKMLYNNNHDLQLTGTFWHKLKQVMIAILHNVNDGRPSIVVCALIGKIAPRLYASSLRKLILKIMTDDSIKYDRIVILVGEIVFLIPTDFIQPPFDRLFNSGIDDIFLTVYVSHNYNFFTDFNNDRNDNNLMSVLETDLSWSKALVISLNKLSVIITEKVRIAWIRKQIKKAREGMQAAEPNVSTRIALSAVGCFSQIVPPGYRIIVICRLTELLASVNRLNISVALKTLNHIYANIYFLELATSDQLEAFINAMLDDLNIPFFILQSEEFLQNFVKTLSRCSEILKERAFIFFIEQGLAKPDKIIIQEAFEILETISVARRKTFLAEIFSTLIADQAKASKLFGILLGLPKLIAGCFGEDYLIPVKDLIKSGFEIFINELLTNEVAVNPPSSYQVIVVDVVKRIETISNITDSIPVDFQQPIIAFLIKQIFKNNDDARYFSVLALSKLAKKIPAPHRQLIINGVKKMHEDDFTENCAFPLLTNLALEMDAATKTTQIIDYLNILVNFRVYNEVIQKNVILLLKHLPEPQLNYFIYGHIPDLIAKSADSLLRLELMVLINKVNKSRSKNIYVSNKLANISDLAELVFDYANEDQIVRLSR